MRVSILFVIGVWLVLGAFVTADPLADGIVSDNEYAHTQSFDNENYQIHWTAINDTIHLGLVGKTTGWVGIGLKPSQMMKDADIILAGIADGSVYWTDAFSTGNFGPHPKDTELGGTDDIMNLSVSEENGVTCVEFTRKLDTGDPYDARLAVGENVPFLWAMSTDDDPAIKHNTPKGKGTMNL
jgi:hypothetical protein